MHDYMERWSRHKSTFAAKRASPSFYYSSERKAGALSKLADPGPGTPRELTYPDLASGGNSPQWVMEYRFPSAYGYSSLNATNLLALAASIHDDPKVRRTFANYYAASAPSPITGTNWPFYSCAETRFTRADYASCAHSP